MLNAWSQERVGIWTRTMVAAMAAGMVWNGPTFVQAVPVTVTAGDPANFGRVIQNTSGLTRSATIAKMGGAGSGQNWTSSIVANDGGISFPVSGSLGNGNNANSSYTITLNNVAAGTGSTGLKSWTINVQGVSQSLGTNPDIAVSATVVANRDLSQSGGTINFGKVLVGQALASQNATITGGAADDNIATRVNLINGNASSGGVTVTRSGGTFLFDTANETTTVSVAANFTTSGSKNSSVNITSLLTNGETAIGGTVTLDSSVLVAYTADVYQAASLTINNGGPAKASGDSLTIANANTSDAGQRAAAQVASVSLTGAPGWSVSDIIVGATISQNTTLTGTALFDATGKLNGAHKATFSATLEHDDQTIAGTSANDLGVQTWNLKHVVTGNTGGGTARVFTGDDYDHNTTRQADRFTTAALIDGSAGGTRDITVSFADNDGIVLSDIVSLTGTLTDAFVLQLSYDEAYVTGSEEDIFLAWWDGLAWVNAVAGNSSGTPIFVLGAYDNDLTLGHYGVDTVNNVVWAVLDHNSDFGVLTAIPEPGTIALALVGLGMVYHRRPRK